MTIEFYDNVMEFVRVVLEEDERGHLPFTLQTFDNQTEREIELVGFVEDADSMFRPVVNITVHYDDLEDDDMISVESFAHVVIEDMIRDFNNKVHGKGSY